MGEKKIDEIKQAPTEVVEPFNWDTLPLMLTPKILAEKVVPWSRKTLARRIDEGFPAIKDGNDVLIPREKARLYFKKREAQGS